MEQENEITQWLIQISNDSDEAYDKLFSLVYNQLHDIAYHKMAKEPDGHTWSKTDLVHEAYIKLIDQSRVDYNSRTHFYAIAARSMRQILVDHARKKKRKKRGGNHQKVTFIDEIMNLEHQVEELLQIDEALNRLKEFDLRLVKIVELHYFGEMNFDEIAKVMNLSERTVYRDWAKARGWLYKELKSK